MFIVNAREINKTVTTQPGRRIGSPLMAGLKPMGFHQLRHSYASKTVMSGLPLLILAGNLGHVDTRMVERHYGHLVQSFKDRMIEEHVPRFGITDESNVIGLNQKN